MTSILISITMLAGGLGSLELAGRLAARRRQAIMIANAQTIQALLLLLRRSTMRGL